jgi:hypothetical protein
MTSLYRFPGCVVEVNDTDRWLVTRFDDGSELHAHPNHDHASIVRAYALGYLGDTWAMSRDHELAHHYLAAIAGHWQSYALWLAANPDLPRDDSPVHAEEARVLRWQATLEPKHRPERPWDTYRDPAR